MKTIRFDLLSVMTLMCMLVIGCSSSKETSGDDSRGQGASEQSTANPSTVKSEAKVAPPVDTVMVDRQNTSRSSYEPPKAPPSGAMPTGRFTVQIGAYKMPDNADRVASLAKERFGKNVYSVMDKDNLYKVMIGDFMTKDEARNFRDEMVQKFSADYKDAWVSENINK